MPLETALPSPGGPSGVSTQQRESCLMGNRAAQRPGEVWIFPFFKLRNRKMPKPGFKNCDIFEMFTFYKWNTFNTETNIIVPFTR